MINESENCSTSGVKNDDRRHTTFPWGRAWKVIQLGLLFLTCYIPFMSVQVLCSVIEKANGFESLGFYLVGVLYFS